MISGSSRLFLFSPSRFVTIVFKVLMFQLCSRNFNQKANENIDLLFSVLYNDISHGTGRHQHPNSRDDFGSSRKAKRYKSLRWNYSTTYYRESISSQNIFICLTRSNGLCNISSFKFDRSGQKYY